MRKIHGLRLRIGGALAYGALMLVGLGWNIWSFQLVMLTLFLISIYEFRNLERLGTGVYYKYGVYLLFSFAISGTFFFCSASLSFLLLIKFLLLIGMGHHLFAFAAMWFGKESWYFPWPSWLRAGLYIGLSFGAIFSYSVGLMVYEPMLILLVLFSIWAADIGAYFVGSLIGKTPLHSTLSPKKTWEGLIGGVLCSFLTVLTFSFFREMTIQQISLFGLIIPLTGTMGDLFISAYKRRAGVKDSGHIIPGHGGILDRIDAYLFCQPFVAYLLF